MAANINMRFTKTNDLISTDFVSVDPALGFEFGYTDLVLSVQDREFSKHTAIGQYRDQPNIGWFFKYKGIQVDYALTDLGNQSAAIYSNIFSVKVDLSVFRN
jgi:hypothetical protein